MQAYGNIYQQTTDVPCGTGGAAGTPVIIKVNNRPKGSSVTVFPGAGGSVLIEYSLSAPGAIDAGNGHWVPWSSGTVTVATGNQFVTPIMAIRATATGAAAVVEVVQ
jgi:hypothetical protein